MSDWAVLSIVALWAAVAVLAVMNVVLYRQLGIMVMGSARGLEESGLPLGRRLPSDVYPTLSGGQWSPAAEAGPYLLFFAGTYCSDCKAILPFVREAGEAGLQVVTMLFNNGPESAQQYAREHPLPGVVVPTTQEMGHAFDVIAVPYAYLVSERGAIADKGLLRSRDRVKEMAAAAGARMEPTAPAHHDELRPAGAAAPVGH